MRRPTSVPQVVMALAFMSMILSAGTIQTASELLRDGQVRVWDLFRQSPTVAHLRAFERELERASLVAGWLRPHIAYVQFQLLNDGGEKALVGYERWLFYRPGVKAITQVEAESPSAAVDPVPAIVDFRDQLARRGIHLLVVPVPNKESIHPRMLSRRASDGSILVSRDTRSLLTRLERQGVEVVNLFEVFRAARESSAGPGDTPLYLTQDTHWSPAGMRLAADAVADRLLQREWIRTGSVTYDLEPASVARFGDLLEMLRIPALLHSHSPEIRDCQRVVRRDDGALYRDDLSADVLVLGDSFLRIYQQDDPGSAGFIAQLAHTLCQPMTSLVNDGGGATLVRQELVRRSELLDGKSVVVWMFVERDMHFDLEHWPLVPLPTEARECPNPP